MRYFNWLIVIVVAYCCNSCYSFKTAGIPPGMETFYVAEFDNTSSNVVPTLATDFAQKLLEKVRAEGKLTFTEYDPHVDFSGAITGFNVSSVAPEEGQTTAFNRLDIRVNITFKNNIDPDPEKGWTQSFGFFEDYPSDVNLLDVQEDLIESITDQIVEDVFNKAFSDW
ncbi:MAG: LPS assembly lipoprotein LptE, partial [Bacteroidota bacterium]